MEHIGERIRMIRNLRIWSLIFLLPGLALFIYIVVLPTIQVINSSMYNWSPGQVGTFVGLNNFTQMFADPSFRDALLHTFVLLIGAMIIQIPLGFIFAYLIFRRYIGSAFFQTVFFIPMVLSSVVIALLWTQVYNQDFGLLNSLLRAVGLGDLTRPWLGDSSSSLISVVVVVGWQYVGLYMLIFLAALQRIPHSIFEAAEIDGAVGVRQLKSITAPLVIDTLKLSVILVVTGAVQYFNLIWAMTQGGPANSSSVLASYMFIKGLQESRLGYAGAVATVMLVVNLILAIGLQRVFRREPLELG
ncbi:MAG: hypothetical protein B5766_07865 [Candidatus Lumbricidophila eiseniae]|uniref:ABC transmembrane type-1 domain-containing protein n=1 Tax=Candidatus Lumbricidiphila eiseniae TaxID=1969409 RepID=A0A2A6FR14_9MICO|nr:MAG: hypothetical protein B5766_07865 [Candidatus Lumbricidophila eiseniae]